jgi:hypothetical protein
MVKWSYASVIRITEASWIYQQFNPMGYGGEKMNLLHISSIFTAPGGNLTTNQIDLCGGMEGESTTERLDLSWPRRRTYYRTVQSLLVNDQSHKIQLEALSRLILMLVNHEKGGFGHIFLLTDLLDHEFQALSWSINLGTQLHTKSNLKHWASLTLRRVSVKEPTTERFIFTVWGWIYYRTIQSYNLGRWTYYRSVQSPELVMNYLFMTRSHHDVTSLDIMMFFYFEISMFAHADVLVLVILRRASRCSCLDWLFWILHYLCKSHCVTSHPFVWAYLITTKSWVLST